VSDTSFAVDVELAAELGYQGLSIDERKLSTGRDAEQLAMFRASGLRAAACCASVTSILSFGPDGPWPVPADPKARVDAICAGIERLAPFHPGTVFCATGDPGQMSRSDARTIVIAGLQKIKKTADHFGVTLSIEPLTARPGALGSLITTMADTFELLADAGEPDIKLIVDIWHLFDTRGFLDDLRRHAGRVSAIHVCDYRKPRSAADRLMPGDGESGVVAIFRAAEEGGFAGWYDLEVFSDELSQLEPREFMRRGAEATRRCLEASRN